MIDWRESPTNRSSKRARLVCDQCHCSFERPARYATHIRHFCSRRCLDQAHCRDGALAMTIQKTMIERYGVKHSAANDVIKEKQRQTSQRKYGVDHPRKSEIVKAKIYDSHIKRFGCHASQSEEIKSKRDFKAAWKKAHETKKRNGSYRTSKIEEQLYDILCQQFGVLNVKRQVMLENTNWPIDFYVQSIDVFVQLDGKYWHGLDRPLHVIREFKNVRDLQIYKKYFSDRKQDEWFTQNAKRLVRITDEELKKLGQKVVERLAQ